MARESRHGANVGEMRRQLKAGGRGPANKRAAMVTSPLQNGRSDLCNANCNYPCLATGFCNYA